MGHSAPSVRVWLGSKEGPPHSRLCTFLRLPFPRVSYRDGSKDFRGQAAAGVFSSLVPWPKELLFLLLSLLLILAGGSWSCLELPPWTPGPACAREGPPDTTLSRRPVMGLFSRSWALLWGQLCFRS